MRKAFDANVPRFKPRLKSSTPFATLPLEERVEDAPAAVRAPVVEPATMASIARAAEQVVAQVAPPAPVAAAPARAAPVEMRSPEAADLDARRERLDKIKRRVAEASRPRHRAEPAPADPAHAAVRVLGLAHELEAELDHARERETALRAELDAARTGLVRSTDEAREAQGRAGALEGELEERRTVLADLLAEMNALEAERDEALRRAQAMAAIDEERARLVEEVSRRAEQEAAARLAQEGELLRLTEELREAGSDGARLRAALSETARERDLLANELADLRRDRAELDAAKKALEQVHTALSQARARLG